MRSRYAAYVRGEIDYILATHDASTRDAVDVEASTKWSNETNWHGLEIVETAQGGPADDVGIVEFIARGVTNGKPFAQRERANFRRHDGRWFYVDGDVRSEPVRKAITVGRNEPCPCGSGQKYKRCHG